MLNGFTEMMKGFWNNQDLKVPDTETLKSKMALEEHATGKLENMGKKQIQEYESKRLINELSKMPPMVIATAYLHAINYTLYGEDVTEKWITATQKTAVLEKAYRKSYYDALQKQTKNVTNGDMI